jgi:hypothetical protein
MTPALTSTITILILGLPTLILIMLLPTLLALKKPKNERPRTTADNISEAQTQTMRTTPITNIENEQKFDKTTIQPLAKIIAVLPNLEA